MPLIISTRCCKVNLFFPTADAVLAVGFDPKTGISEGLVLFSILSGDFWWGWEKNSAIFLMFHLGGGARFD